MWICYFFDIFFSRQYTIASSLDSPFFLFLQSEVSNCPLQQGINQIFIQTLLGQWFKNGLEFLHIDNSESPITLPAEAKTIIADVVSIDEKIKDTKIHLKKLEKERDSGQTKIKNMLGNKTKAVFVDIVNQIRYEISWAAQSREVVDKEALKDFPDAYAAAVKINPEYSRPFKINARKLPK